MKIRDWKTGGGYLRGVDVSAYQGTINYAKMKDNGIKYAILRAYGSASKPDSKIVEYARGFRSVGIPCGSYFFCTISDEYDLNSARSQANAYASKLEEAFGSGSWGDLLPFIDLEGNENVGGRHTSLNTTAMLTWVDEFRKTFQARFNNRVKLGIYTSWYFIYDHNNFNHGRTSAGNILKDMPLWMAKWRTTSINDVGGWTNWVLWQYTDNAYPFSSGYTVGVSSSGLDMNYTESLDDIRTISSLPTGETGEEKERTFHNANFLKASLQTNNTIGVVWKKSLQANVQKQELYRNGELLTTLGKDIETYNDKNVVFGEQYYYRIRTYDKEMWIDSDPSNIVKTLNVRPTIPIGLTVEPLDRALKVTWLPNPLEEGVTDYTLYMNGVKHDKANKTEYTIQGLIAGTDYSFRVQAHNENPSPSDISASVTSTPIIVVPETPANLLTKITNNKEIHLTWEHYQDEDFSHYDLRVNGLLVATNIKNKNYVFKGLGTNVDYTFQVIAFDLDGDISESPTVSARMNEPTKVKNIRGRSFDRKLEIEWDFATFVPNPTVIAEVETETTFDETNPPVEEVPATEPILVVEPIGEPIPIITEDELANWEEQVEELKQEPIVQPVPAPIPAPTPPPPPKYSLVSYDKLKQNALALTSVFETSRTSPQCFGITAGNFDGAGVSHGAIQYNLGSGTLQPILQELVSKHSSVVKQAFNYSSNSSYYNSLVSMLGKSKASQVSWGASITNPSNKHKLKEPYATYFYNLGITKEAIAIQVKHTESYFKQGMRHFEKFGLWSRRGYALCFDIAVQSWSISSTVESAIFSDFAKIIKTGKTDSQIETEKMVIITNRRGDAIPSTWRKAWKDRKMAISKGSGWVHSGTLFMDTRNYDMILQPAFADNIPKEFL